MEKNKKTLLLTLAMIFIGIFLLASVFAMNEYNGKISQTTGSNYVVQTYRTSENYNGAYNGVYRVSYNSAYGTQRTPTRIVYLNNYNSNRIYYTGIYQSGNTGPVIDTSIKYTQYATQETRKDFIGTYVKEYSVSVTNWGKTGRYFTVTFNLEDKNGYESSQAVTQYLKGGENKKFVYKSIQFEKNEILNWNYDITPQNY